MLMIFDELTDPKIIDTDAGDDLDHIYCKLCYPNGELALCGVDVSDANEYDGGWLPDDNLCVVCDDLDGTHKEMYHKN